MLSLDSPRWKELNQAYGSASEIPGLLRAVAEGESSSAWEDIWSSLCHQYSIYSATYAAIPHLVSLAEQGSLKNRLEVLIFCSTVRLFGKLESEVVSEDLCDSYNSAMNTIKGLALGLIQEASKEELLDKYPLPFLIQAVLGLQFGPYPSICILDRLAEGSSEIEAECPKCGSAQFFDLANLPGEARTKSAQSQGLENGATIIQEIPPDGWSSGSIVQVAAALASSFGDDRLSAMILGLNTETVCEACAFRYRISDGFDVL